MYVVTVSVLYDPCCCGVATLVVAVPSVAVAGCHAAVPHSKSASKNVLLYLLEGVFQVLSSGE